MEDCAGLGEDWADFASSIPFFIISTIRSAFSFGIASISPSLLPFENTSQFVFFSDNVLRPAALNIMLEEKTPFCNLALVMFEYGKSSRLSRRPSMEGSLIRSRLFVANIIDGVIIDPPGLILDCFAITKTFSSGSNL